MVLETKLTDQGTLKFDEVDVQRGAEVLDRQARRYLNLSGEDFARLYRAGQIPDQDRSEVIRVALLLPLIGESSIGGENR